MRYRIKVSGSEGNEFILMESKAHRGPWVRADWEHVIDGDRATALVAIQLRNPDTMGLGTTELPSEEVS